MENDKMISWPILITVVLATACGLAYSTYALINAIFPASLIVADKYPGIAVTYSILTMPYLLGLVLVIAATIVAGTGGILVSIKRIKFASEINYFMIYIASACLILKQLLVRISNILSCNKIIDLFSTLNTTYGEFNIANAREEIFRNIVFIVIFTALLVAVSVFFSFLIYQQKKKKQPLKSVR